MKHRTTKAFETLENRISDKSCLEFPEPDWYYELDKDVSLNGIGAVLFQKDPSVRLFTIKFVSKVLSKAQKKQAIPVSWMLRNCVGIEEV